MAAGIAAGRMPPPQRQRLMSLARTIRMTVAMTLMPDVSYTGVIQQLAGHLADVPFDRDWHVPACGVTTGWRGKVPLMLDVPPWRRHVPACVHPWHRQRAPSASTSVSVG